MRIFVGQAGSSGDLRRYAGRFNLLELRAAHNLPKPATLARWKSEVPEGFAFSLVLPDELALLEASTIDESALERTLAAASALDATWLIVRTPPSARPSSRTRRRLEELVARLPRDQHRIAWEPRGLWEDEDAEQLAHALGVVLVRDVSKSEAPPGDVVYARLRALGSGGRVSSGAIEDAIDELDGKREAYVVVEGPTAARAAKMLREALAGDEAFAHDDSDLDDDEDEDEDDDVDAIDDDEDEDEA